MIASRFSSSFSVFLAFLFVLGLSVSIPQTSSTPVPAPKHKNAFAAVYSHDTPDRDERLLATRVMIRSLQITRPKADVVVMVSASTPSDVRNIFAGYGCVVIEIQDKAAYFDNANNNNNAASGASATASPVLLQLAASASAGSSSSSSSSSMALASSSSSSSSSSSAGGFQASLRSSVYARKCPFNRDFMYLWTLTQYHRVVYVEADTLVFRNLDDLFKCGHFCMVYANENCWHSGFLILKPSLAEFRRFFSHYAAKSAAIEQRYQQSFLAPRLTCVNEYHDSILQMFPGIEAAPLFYARDGQSEVSIQRVNLIYGVNAIFFYEHFTWILYRLNLPLKTHGGSYDPNLYRMVDERTLAIALNPNATDDYQWGIPNDVPAFSISFFEPHPYSWWEASYFDLNWWWHQTRSLIAPETNADVLYVLATRLAALLATYWVMERVMASYFNARFREQSAQAWDRVYAYFVLHTGGGTGAGAGVNGNAVAEVVSSENGTNHSNGTGKALSPPPLTAPTAAQTDEVALSGGGACRLPVSPRFLAAIRGTFIGCVVILVTAFLTRPLIPGATAPAVAWPLFCLWQNYLIYLVVKVSLNFFPFPEHHVTYEEPTIAQMLPPFLMEIATLVHNKSDLHNHFVKKIIVFVVMVSIVFLLQSRWFRKMSVTRYELAHGIHHKGGSGSESSGKVLKDKDEIHHEKQLI